MCLTCCCWLQEETHRDPDLVVLWTTKDWDVWPRGLSKAAARVMCDPLVLYTIMAPVWILAFNVSWPHRVAQQSPRTRAMYVMKKLLALPCLYAAMIWILNASVTFLWVRRPVLSHCVWGVNTTALYVVVSKSESFCDTTTYSAVVLASVQRPASLLQVCTAYYVMRVITHSV